jgi:hypothetical protein
MENIYLETFCDDKDGMEDCQEFYENIKQQIEKLENNGCKITKRAVVSADAIHYLPYTYYTLSCPSGTYDKMNNECNEIRKKSNLNHTKKLNRKHQDALDRHNAQCSIM